MAAEQKRSHGRAWLDRFRSVRARTTGVAVLVVGVALITGAAILVMLLRDQLTDQVRSSARLRARDVASALESGTPPNELAVSNDKDLLIQVVAPNGSVIASSRNVAGRPAVAELAPGRSKTVEDTRVGGERHDFLVVAVGARDEGEQQVVLVARANDLVLGSTRLLIGVLVAGIPLLLLVVGMTTWKLTGRALSPVEDMRAEVDAISASELHRRVLDPPGSDEIAHLASTMNRMLERIERSVEAQRRFVSDASHELRSPVATIRQHAEVAIAHPGRTSASELAHNVMNENLRVQSLIEDLLLLARTETPNAQLRWRPVDLDDLLLAEMARARTATDLRIDGAGISAGRVEGDAAQLGRLVRNLVDNAMRHAATVIELGLRTTGSSVILTIEDDGAGIPETERERVFERFVRLDEARARDDGGSGLGLAIVAQIAAAHGGSVRISDGSSGGARVDVLFPATTDGETRRPAPSRPPARERTTAL